MQFLVLLIIEVIALYLRWQEQRDKVIHNLRADGTYEPWPCDCLESPCQLYGFFVPLALSGGFISQKVGPISTCVTTIALSRRDFAFLEDRGQKGNSLGAIPSLPIKKCTSSKPMVTWY